MSPAGNGAGAGANTGTGAGALGASKFIMIEPLFAEELTLAIIALIFMLPFLTAHCGAANRAALASRLDLSSGVSSGSSPSSGHQSSLNKCTRSMEFRLKSVISVREGRMVTLGLTFLGFAAITTVTEPELGLCMQDFNRCLAALAGASSQYVIVAGIAIGALGSMMMDALWWATAIGIRVTIAVAPALPPSTISETRRTGTAPEIIIIEEERAGSMTSTSSAMVMTGRASTGVAITAAASATEKAAGTVVAGVGMYCGCLKGTTRGRGDAAAGEKERGTRGEPADPDAGTL